MFERYTEKARRTIFYARYESSQFGSRYIETEHLLLGLLREDKALAYRFLHSGETAESIRKEIDKHTPVREKIATTVDLPLSNECKRALAYAAEESERSPDRHIGTEHILLGLLREQGSFAASLLKQHGVTIDDVRSWSMELASTHHPASPRSTPAASNVQSPLGYSTHTVKVADVPASVVFYSKMGFRQIAGRKEDGVVVMTQGLTRLALYEQHLAERLLCFYGANLQVLGQTLQDGGLAFRRPPVTAAGERDLIIVRDLDRNLWYFLAAHPDDDKDPGRS